MIVVKSGVLDDALDIDELKYYIFSTNHFKVFWSAVAWGLGYSGVTGLKSKLLGKNLLLTVDNDKFILQGEENPNKLNLRLKIIVSNIKFNIIGDSIKTKDVTTKELTPEVTALSNYFNNYSQDANIVKKITILKSDKTTVSYSNKFATSVEVSADVKFNLPAFEETTSISYNFSHDYTMGNQKEQTNIKKLTDEVSMPVSAKNKGPVNLIVYKNLVKVPFTALAQVSYNIQFDGYIQVKRNAYKDTSSFPYKEDYVEIKSNFGNENMSAMEDLLQQLNNSINPYAKTAWNWEIFKSARVFKNVLSPIAEKEIAVEFAGQFDKINSNNIVVEIGHIKPLN